MNSSYSIRDGPLEQFYLMVATAVIAISANDSPQTSQGISLERLARSAPTIEVEHARRMLGYDQTQNGPVVSRNILGRRVPSIPNRPYVPEETRSVYAINGHRKLKLNLDGEGIDLDNDPRPDGTPITGVQRNTETVRRTPDSRHKAKKSN